jgi:hypothetical protein
MRKKQIPPPDGKIRELFEAGKNTGQIAKELEVGRDVVAAARHRIYEGRIRDQSSREDNRRSRPEATAEKVMLNKVRDNGSRQVSVVISLPRIKTLHGEFKETANG